MCLYQQPSRETGPLDEHGSPPELYPRNTHKTGKTSVAYGIRFCRPFPNSNDKLNDSTPIASVTIKGLAVYPVPCGIPATQATE